MLNWAFALLARLRSRFSLDRVDQDFERELREHLELLTAENIRRGLSPEEARRQARLRLGGITQIRATNREQQGLPFADTLLQDLRYALRSLRKNYAFTLIAVVTLALGIGANAAIFSVIHAVLLQPLPYDHPERIALLRESNPEAGFPSFAVSPPNFVDWRNQSTFFEQIACASNGNFNYTSDGEPERILGSNVSASFFQVFGVAPAMGRTFSTEDDVIGKAHVVVLSHGLWARRFASDPYILGKSLTLSGNAYSVIGVMPAGFQFPTRVELWLPSEFAPRDLAPGARGAHYLRVMGRVKAGVTLQQAQLEMTAIAKRLQGSYPDKQKGWTASVISLNEATVHDIRPTLVVLFIAVGFLLLIACANVANLLLARAAGRYREMAIRMSLGAGRWRIVRQLLTESILLSSLGGALGLLLAEWGIGALRTLPASSLPRAADIQLDFTVLSFTAVLAFLTGILFGLAPALQGSVYAPSATLKEGGRTSSARRGMRSSLVVVETALALVLLIGSGLLLKSLLRLQNVDPGYQSRNLLTAVISLPGSKYSTDSQKSQFFDQLLTRLRDLPGVRAAGAASSSPLLNQRIEFAFATRELAALSPSQQPSTGFYSITPDYFRAIGTPLLAGRFFTPQDTDTAPPVAIISQTLAQQFFRDRNPIGQVISSENGSNGPQWREIVGVVGDIKDEGLDNSAAALTLYEPTAQIPWSSMTVFLRTDSDPASLAGSLRSQVLGVDKAQPVAIIATGDQLMADAVAQPHFRTLLIGLFAALALILAAFGIYGVMSNAVAQRTQEIGVRIALGAQSRSVLRLVVGNGLRLTLLGTVLGLAGAVVLTRTIKTFLFQVNPLDPTTFAAVAAFLLFVAFLACYLPARRAMRVDPVVALRYE